MAGVYLHMPKLDPKSFQYYTDGTGINLINK